jgi:hypothetical protein
MTLARLWPALGIRGALDKFDGSVSLELPFHDGTKGRPEGAGAFRLEHLRYGDREITPLVQSKVRLIESEMRFEQIESVLGSGSILGLVVINIEDFNRSRAILSLRAVPAERALLPLPDIARRLDALLDVQVRTSLGRQIRGTAVISTANGKIAGQRIGALRIPIEWDLVPGQERGQLSVRDLSGELDQGRFSGEATYEFYGNTGSTLLSKVQFSNLNVSSMVSTQTEFNSLGISQATGSFEFSGRDVRSVDDLSAKLTATLGKVQMTNVPVLKEVLPFLGPSALTTDRRSEVRAVLSRGVWRIERLALVGQNLQLFGDGTVSNAGRLDLQITANTGRLAISPLALQALGLKLPVTVGPIPVALIADATQYISQRTINLEVAGTVASPVVRIKPLGLLTQEAIQFFLNKNNIPVP